MMSLANRALVGHGSSHWSESQIFHVNDIQAELICDANGRILAAVQPDDGGSWVLYGQTRIAEGVYVDMESAKKAGEKLRFDCPAIPKGMEGIP
jgi:hypothetical protein